MSDLDLNGYLYTDTGKKIPELNINPKAYIDKTSPYVGEQVIVTYKIYTKIPVTQYGIDKLPAFTGSPPRFFIMSSTGCCLGTGSPFFPQLVIIGKRRQARRRIIAAVISREFFNIPNPLFHHDLCCASDSLPQIYGRCRLQPC